MNMKSKKIRSNIITFGLVIVFYAVMEAMLVTGNMSSLMKGLLVPLCYYMILAASLNLVVGISGELSLGHAGFMSVGAFSGVVAAAMMESSIPSEPLRLFFAILIGGIIAGLAGFVIGIPVLRLRGDYLAIVTLAFGEIIKNILNCLYIGVDSRGLHIGMEDSVSLGMETGGRILVNGPVGAVGVHKMATFTAGFLLILFSLLIVLNMKRSRTGRAIMAVRDNRIAAESVGIPITRYKMTAFITSAMLAGMAGVLFAMNYTSLIASKFDFNTSILVLVFVVLGGMGNIRGSILSTVVLYILPEMLRGLEDFRMLIYAIVLIAVMLVTNSDRVRQMRDKLAAKRQSKKEKAEAEKGGSAA